MCAFARSNRGSTWRKDGIGMVPLILLLHTLPNSGQSANVLWSLSVEYGMGVYRRRWKVSPMAMHYQPSPR